MEQKFTFKKLLSLFVVCAMLLSSFTFLAFADEPTNVALGKEYTLSGCGERTSYYANLTDGNAKEALSYNNDEWFGFYCNGTDASVINAPDKVGYAIIDLEGSYDISEVKINVVDNEGGSGISKPTFAKAYLSEDGETWGEAVELAIPASTTKGIAYSVEGAVEGTASFVKVEIGLAATFAFLNEIEVYGVASEEDPGESDAATMTVDGDLAEWGDDWTEVTAENGYWQSVPEESNASYKFQMYDDGETLYVAAELFDVDCTGLRIWFRTNNEATVYTSFYDIKAGSVAGKYNTSLTANSGAAIENSVAEGAYVVGESSTTVEFAVSFEEIGAVDGEFDYYINTQGGTETLFYPAVEVGENDNRLANLPYNNWYVAPDAPDAPKPVEPEQHDILVSHVNAYTWGVYNAMVIVGEGKNSMSELGYDCQWWIAIKVDDVDGVLTVTSVEGSGTAKENTCSADGFILYVYSNDADSFAAAKLVEVDDVLLACDLDWTTKNSSETPLGTMSFGPAREDEGTDPDEPEVETFNISVGSINAYGWGNDGYPVILAYGEGGNVASKVGGNWFEWWYKAKAEWNETEGAFIVNAVDTSGSKEYEAWTFTANEIAFLVFSGTETYATEKDIIANLAIGDKLYASGFDFTNASANNLIVDGVSSVNFSNVEFEEEPDPEDPGVELPEDAIVLDYAGYVHASYFMIVAGDNMTVAELTALGIGEAKDMNYCVVAVVDADNVITEMYTTLGRPDGVKSDVVCPEGGYLIVLNANKAGYEPLLAANVGDSIVLYNVDVDSFRGAEGSIALENAGFAIVATPVVPVIPGLPENITHWGSGAGVEVMTDGYTGVDEINTWEGNTDKLYGFSNSVLDAAEYSFDITIEETTFDAVTLYVLDFVNGGVTLPDAVSFVINDVWYEATINGNENNIGTIVVELDEAVTASTITVVVSMGASPHTFAIFNMFTELEVNEYIPVTSKVVTDFNPEKYSSSIGGATGAFIYDDAEIYANCGCDWWIHTSFTPVADMEGYYEVVAIRAPTTGNYLTIPENGFVWVAWSSAGGTPESAGAYALDFMSNLKVGDIINFVGVDFANHTTEADAYAEVWVDPNAPVNVALGKDYTLSGAEDANYNAKLTDGNAYGGMSYDNKWFIFNASNTVDGIGTAIIDLAGDFNISKVAVNLINETGSGVAKPEYVKFYVSADGEEWTELGAVELQDVQSAAYWTALENLEVTGRYVKLEMKIGNPFSFLNEIEVYGAAAPVVEEIELVEGENEITVPAGGSAVANTNFDKDLVITIEGQWDVTVLVNGTEYYPNRMGNLEAPLLAGENTVEFKNSSETDASIVAVLAAPVVGDTMDDPIILEQDGDYTADVTEKHFEGVYYQYTATEDGTVTITITSESGWLYVVNNVTAGKYGDMHASDDETVVSSETIEVTAGDEIQILVSTFDPENPWSAPVGTVDFTLDVPGEAAPETVELALGDINMDGEIDQYDYILAKRHYFNTIVLSDIQLELGDVNVDGVVNQYDYILLCRHYFNTFVIEGTVEVPVEALPAPVE